MHEGYKKYLDVLASRGMDNPMSEKDWMAAVGIKEEEHTPFVSRKKESFRNVEPTLSNHEAPKATAQLRVNLMDIPKESRDFLPTRIDNLMDTPKAGRDFLPVRMERPLATTKAVEPKKQRVQTVPKTSLKGMSKEERLEHRNKLARNRYKRDKENGVLQKSEEVLIKRRQVCKDNYQKNREKRLEAARKRRENMTPEQKAEAKAYLSRWQQNNRDRVNANAREWKKKNRKPQAQNNTSCSADQSLSA